ncbi:MAG: hypothetical protein Q7U88_13280 [Desulfocapsaceae bacterium]|nr:hypothetical protein [Desulfocapsaceae bacterium]
MASRLGITTTTLYAYVNGDGSVKESEHRFEIERPLITAKAERTLTKKLFDYASRPY